METMENAELIETIRKLKEENDSLENEILNWKGYTQKILRLINVFRNEHAIAQTKCIQGIENSDEKEVGFSEFLRGKLHTINEIINDFHIINSIKFVDEDEEAGYNHFLRGKLHSINEIIDDLHIINSIKNVDEEQEEEKERQIEPVA